MDYYLCDLQWDYRPRDRYLDPGSDSDSDMSWKGPHSPSFNIQSNVPGTSYLITVSLIYYTQTLYTQKTSKI
jgi:hypothetical protein